jgi:hypothetical protein
MVKASRSKKQPAFDASELADLIFSPAVGTGVGSHLVAEQHPEGKSPTGSLVKASVVAAALFPFPAPLRFPDLPIKIEPVKTHHPEGNLPLDVTQDAPNKPTIETLHPEGDLHIGLPSLDESKPDIAGVQVESPASENRSHPQGKLPIAQAFMEVSTAGDPVIPASNVGAGKPLRQQPFRPEGKLHTGLKTPASRQSVQTDLIDGAILGRRQKVRRAVVAQDGHSSGEQLLYQSLWNAASAETPDTRLLSIGYNGMSSLCKLDRSNCKKNIQSLLDKLAVEVTKSYQTASSTGTTYRIFSYGEILRRRKSAGLIWVIRTSGVRFVNPMGDLPIGPVRDLPTAPVGELPTAGVGESPTPPVCETPTPLGKNRKVSETPSSSSVVYKALSQFGIVDDDVLNQLISSCKEEAPDCTDDEIAHFVREKGAMVRAGRISNPIGFLLTAVPKCFSGETFRYFREEQGKLRELAVADEARHQAEDAEWRAHQEKLLLDPALPDDHKKLIREWLGISKQGVGFAESQTNFDEDLRKG